MQKYPMRASRAFTLIALLVVITIVAALAAVLFPVFAKVRENARRMVCLSNIKQIITDGHVKALLFTAIYKSSGDNIQDLH